MELDVPIETNTYNTSSSSDFIVPDSGLQGLYNLVNLLNKYLVPIIIVTGFLGNSISFLVFIFSQLNRLSMSVYLAALAFADTGFLVCVGIGWLDNVGIDVFNIYGICQVLVWVTYVFSFVSVWYVVCFTTEIYLTIFHSHLGEKVGKPKKARFIVCFFFFFACAIYMYSFWSAKPLLIGGKLVCIPFFESRNMLIGLTLADTIVTLLIPFALLIFMNIRIMIIMKVYHVNVDEENAVPHECPSSRASAQVRHTGADHWAKYASKVQRKTTKMLVTVAMLFLFLNLPSHAIRVQSVLRTLFQTGYVATEIEYLCQQMVQLLYYSNFAINFVVYNACAKSFRRAIPRVLGMLCCCCLGDPDRSRRVKKGGGKKRNFRRENQERIQNSRLVEVHLSEMHLSQVHSFGPSFVCRSPPCLLKGDDDDAETPN